MYKKLSLVCYENKTLPYRIYSVFRQFRRKQITEASLTNKQSGFRIGGGSTAQMID